MYVDKNMWVWLRVNDQLWTGKTEDLLDFAIASCQNIPITVQGISFLEAIQGQVASTEEAALALSPTLASIANNIMHRSERPLKETIKAKLDSIVQPEYCSFTYSHSSWWPDLASVEVRHKNRG